MKLDDISCEEVIEALFTFLDRELDDEFDARIERHLSRCRDCFSRAEFERRLRGRVQGAGEARAPESLHRRLHDLINSF